MKFTFLGAFMLAASISPAQAQQADPRWSPWLGCWQLAGESVRVCVAPATGGVTLRTFVDAAASVPALEQSIVGDGTDHPISEGECRGTQRADWSRSGERLFARAELTCGDRMVRRVSGLSMIAGAAWIDIQAIEVEGRESVRVRRYRRADAPIAIAPRIVDPSFTLEEVKEASARLSPRVLEAALMETRSTFDLSSRALLDLRDAGVAPPVIDVMVALSYPEQFVVDAPGSFGSSALMGLGFPYYAWSMYPYVLDGLYSPYYYSPFGYAYWARDGLSLPYGRYLPGSGFITVDGGAPAAGAQAGDGRAINGVGYTRIRPRSESAERTDAGDRRINSGGSTSSGSSDRSSSGASSSGLSSGESSTDTGRTAQPR